MPFRQEDRAVSLLLGDEEFQIQGSYSRELIVSQWEHAVPPISIRIEASTMLEGGTMSVLTLSGTVVNSRITPQTLPVLHTKQRLAMGCCRMQVCR